MHTDMSQGIEYQQRIFMLEKELHEEKLRHMNNLHAIFEVREHLSHVAESLLVHHDPMVKALASKIKVVLGLASP